MRWALPDSQPAEVTSSRGRALPAFTQAARTARMVQVQREPEDPRRHAAEGAAR